jgi:hypothetical protein
MEEHYTSDTDYVVEMLIEHTRGGRKTEAVEFFCDLEGEVMPFDCPEDAHRHALGYLHAADLLGKRSPLTCHSFVKSRLLMFKVLKREKSYVCAAADDFWDEVDCEVTVERMVHCDNA